MGSRKRHSNSNPNSPRESTTTSPIQPSDQPPHPSIQEINSKKWRFELFVNVHIIYDFCRNWWTRLIWTVVMISFFALVLLSGHLAVIFFIVLIQAQIFKEVISIAHVPSKEKKLPFFQGIVLLQLNFFYFFM